LIHSILLKQKKNLDDNFISLRGFRAIEGPKEHFSKEFEAIWR
jgi:hypothetical protein